jgi:hypothetical protein
VDEVDDKVDDQGVHDISSLLDQAQALRDRGLLEEQQSQDNWMD